VWLRSEGLSGAQIAIIVSAPLFARTFVGPAIAVWADGFRLRRTPMIWLGAGSALAYASMAVLHGFWWWLIAWFVGTSCQGSLSPLADVIALRRAVRDGFAYGVPRGVGSTAYICGNVGMGLILVVAPSISVLVWTVVAASLAALGARLALPGDPVNEATVRLAVSKPLAGLSALLADPIFMLAVVSNGLIEASHGFYYSFSALAWRRQGLAEGWIGALWGFAVGAEVIFMFFGEGWRRRVGPAALVIIGGVGAVVRWTALAFSPPLAALFPLQVLHAMSMTATFMGSLRLIQRLSPAASATAAQTLNASIVNGVLGLATIASGPLFDRLGARGYLSMTDRPNAPGLADRLSTRRPCKLRRWPNLRSSRHRQSSLFPSSAPKPHWQGTPQAP
jgi:PPP family 3-phenylpropionic acid transporter